MQRRRMKVLVPRGEEPRTPRGMRSPLVWPMSKVMLFQAEGLTMMIALRSRRCGEGGDWGVEVRAGIEYEDSESAVCSFKMVIIFLWMSLRRNTS